MFPNRLTLLKGPLKRLIVNLYIINHILRDNINFLVINFFRKKSMNTLDKIRGEFVLRGSRDVLAARCTIYRKPQSSTTWFPEGPEADQCWKLVKTGLISAGRTDFILSRELIIVWYTRRFNFDPIIGYNVFSLLCFSSIFHPILYKFSLFELKTDFRTDLYNSVIH